MTFNAIGLHIHNKSMVLVLLTTIEIINELLTKKACEPFWP